MQPRLASCWTKRALTPRPSSQSRGLTAAVAESRLKQYGFNEIAREKTPSALIRLLSNVKNPLVILLTALGVVSFLTGDQRATVVISVMVLLGVVLRFAQEMRADHAAEKLQAMVSNTATVVRDGQESELSLKLLVPGDIVRLAAGDMVPADVRVLSAKDLFVNQAALTGSAARGAAHKERIIRALQSTGYVTGFMGDGINDAPALKAADVGISVDSAVDIAKESSDIILLENSLLILEQGVLEGRRVFGNIIKYIKMAASSNFGTTFSVLGASIFLPFLPMLPIQVLTNNLLYDFSQTTIPTDTVDAEWLTKPREWTIGEIQRFILFIGPISSIFDYLTFFIMLYVFNAWSNPRLFQTGWFVESLLTQTLIFMSSARTKSRSLRVGRVGR